MQGLLLAEQYFTSYGIPLIEEKFPRYIERIAAGLVGDGSECFGFDDEISRDHDWGPTFCLWLTKDDFVTIGPQLQQEISQLPKQFAGLPARQESALGAGRTGVLEITQFYKRFIGFDHVPENLLQWRVIPEVNLATATNGNVFTDLLGEFTTFREKLLAFYPEDIRLKKIASRCMTIAQSGQYNYKRCIAHGETVAAHYAEAQFIEAAISMIFLLNKRYKPFYKWMHRAVKGLPILGDVSYQLLYDLVNAPEIEKGPQLYELKANLIEQQSELIINELRNQQLTDADSDFLLDHGPSVQSKIHDAQIKAISVWLE